MDSKSWRKFLNFKNKNQHKQNLIKENVQLNTTNEEKLYRLEWRGGSKSNLLTESTAIKTINNWIQTQVGWSWIKCRDQNGKFWVISEPSTKNFNIRKNMIIQSFKK